MAELKVSPIASRLRASILQQAVEGKLVPQDPAEGTADELLEQIRKQRAELVKQKKAKAPKGGESRIYQSADGSWYEQRGKGEPKCIDNEIPFDIPESWGWARVGDVAVHQNGFAFKPTDRTPEGIPIVRIQNLTDESTPFNRTNMVVDDCFRLKSGELLVSWSATLKAFMWNRGDAYLNQHIFKVTPYDGIEKRYYACFMNCTLPKMKGKTNGTTLHHLTKPVYEGMLFPIPPTAEQNRILAKIDALMPLVDELEIRERESDAVDSAFWRRLPQSILQEAVQGRLVPQDDADEPADILLESIRKQRAELVKQKKAKAPKGGESRIYQGADGSWYEQRGKSAPVCIDEEIPFDIPESWEWARLESLAVVKTGLGYKKSDLAVNSDDMTRVLRGGNISSDGRLLIKQDDVMISSEFVDPALYLRIGQLVTPAVTSLENVGKCAFVDSSLENTVCGGFVFFVTTVYNNPVFQRYLFDYWLSSTHQCFCRSNVKKSGQAFYNLGKTVLNTALIPIPPLAEQKRIVAKVDGIFGFLKRTAA